MRTLNKNTAILTVNYFNGEEELGEVRRKGNWDEINNRNIKTFRSEAYLTCTRYTTSSQTFLVSRRQDRHWTNLGIRKDDLPSTKEES